MTAVLAYTNVKFKIFGNSNIKNYLYFYLKLAVYFPPMILLEFHRRE